MSVYPQAFGMTKEHALMILKNKAVVVADEDGGQGLVKPVADPQSPLGPLVALVRHGPQPDLADSGIGRLRAGKIARTHQKKHIQTQTRRVQRKPTP